MNGSSNCGTIPGQPNGRERPGGRVEPDALSTAEVQGVPAKSPRLVEARGRLGGLMLECRWCPQYDGSSRDGLRFFTILLDSTMMGKMSRASKPSKPSRRAFLSTAAGAV